MTSEQDNHVIGIVQRLVSGVTDKYEAGQKEHGGNLWKKSGIIRNIHNETFDFAVYVDVLKQQLQMVQSLLHDGKFEQALKWMDAILSEGMEEVVDN